MLSVEDGIGELPNPIAQDHHARLAGKDQIEFDVTMTIDEVVDVGV